MKKQNNIQHLKEILFFGLILLTMLYWAYGNTFNLFYQQDEWATLGIFLSGGIQAYLRQYSPIQVIAGTGRFLSIIFYYPFFTLFPFQIWPFAVISLFFHFINSFLVFVFAYQLSRKYFFACIASIFFLCCSVSSQAVTWFASSMTTLPSTTFLLLSFILAVMGSERRKLSLFFVAQLCAIASFLFKESGFLAFIFVPYLYFLWNKSHIAIKKAIAQMIPLIVYGIFVLGVNIYRIMIASLVPHSSFVENSPYVLQKLLIHVFQYPLVSLSQLFIPQKIMFSLAQLFQTINYSHLERFTSSQLGVESIVSDFVSFIFSMIIITCCVYIAKGTMKYKQLLFFSLWFILISFLPFVMLIKQNSYLDSRYFYNGAIGGGLLVGSIIFALSDYVQHTYRRLAHTAILILMVVTGCFLWKHVQYIQRDINVLVIDSSKRIRFFRQLQLLYPKPPDRPVFYITGNDYGYYGIQELKIPFQQGPGYTLMAWYYRTGIIPSKFLLDYYLWGVRDEGYKESDGKAFGYFWNKQSLIKAIKEYNISENQIIGVYYENNSQNIIDITKDLRNELMP